MGSLGTRPGPRILGLTGPIACGKTTVGNLLLELGAIERIDADAVVHDLMCPGTDVSGQVGRTFGPEILRPDGSVDRGRLANVVFAEPQALHRLEGIVHPAVRQAIRQRLSELQGRTGVVVVDAVKLLQSDLLPLCDAVWVVSCGPEPQEARLREIRRMGEMEARDRLAAQPSFDHKAVTEVIDNSRSLHDLQERVSEAWNGLLREWGHEPASRGTASTGQQPDTGCVE